MSRFLLDARQDLQYASRALVQHPSFTAAAVLSLAIGIGASTAVFSVVDAALLRPLPYRGADRLMAVHGTSSTSAGDFVSYPNFLDWRARTRTFEGLAAWHLAMFTLEGEPGAERVIGGRVSDSYFSTLGVAPLLGRTLDAREDRPGGPRVVLLGEGLWRRRFGADPDVVGQPVTLDGDPYHVIGVMPGHVGVGVIPRLYNDVFVPIGQNDDPLFVSRDVHAVSVIGRLRLGFGRAEADAEMTTIAQALAEAYPDANRGTSVSVVPLEEDLVGSVRSTLLLLLATVALVWLIACANVTNLMLARYARRADEFATRVALGASRWRMFRQALTESTCLAGAGALGGVVAAAWGTRATLSVLPEALPNIVSVDLTWRVLIVAAVTAVVSGLICGVVPAVWATRPGVTQRLPQSQRTPVHAHGVQRAFLVAQLALAVTLMAGTGLLTRSLLGLWRVDPGFDPRGVVTFMSGLPRERAGDPERVRSAIAQVADRLAAVPHAQAASGVFGALPYTGNNNAVDFWRADAPPPAGGDAPLALFSAVGPDYFRVMGIAMHRGRGFAGHDTSQSPRVAIIDDAFAARVFPGEEPIGQRIRLDRVDGPVEVVGVVGAVKHWGLDGRAAGHGSRVQVYVPMTQLPDALAPLAATAFSVVVRTSTTSADMLGTLRSTLRELDNGHVMVNGTGLEDGVARSLADRRFAVVLLGAFAVLGLTLAVVGVYGLVSYLGTGRTRELGVRIALGAQRHDIAVALLAPMGKVVLVGILLGLLGSVGVTRLITAMLFGVTPTDPVTLGSVAGLLALVALTASSVPVRRAWRVDPVVALRHE